jgi:MinD superfamily P-loop ATPase
MIRIAVLSGKGGTGKTVVTGGFADLCGSACALADCDVDAANLVMLLDCEQKSSSPFFGLEKAKIDQNRCTRCGICSDACRFSAIIATASGYAIDPVKCEGCGVCLLVCPEEAVTFVKRQDGVILYSEGEAFHLSHAELRPGSGGSGLLVHAVKKQALEKDGDRKILLIDGPPGIGCPVIAAMSGMDAVVMVTEPSISACHDLSRLIAVSRGFDCARFCIINRYDLDTGITADIEKFCGTRRVIVLGKIPFDPAVLEAVRQGIPITRCKTPASAEIKKIWRRLLREVNLK